MSTAVIISIADAVLNVINSATLSQSVTAERSYVPIHFLESVNELKVTVVPTAKATILQDRSGRTLNDYVVDIGVQKRISLGTLTNEQINAECDPLMLLAEEISELFRAGPLIGYEQARMTQGDHRPIFVPQHLDEKKVFTSVISLVFKLGR